MDPAASRRYRDFLDWPELLLRLADGAQSDRGADACRQLPLFDDPQLARQRMAEVSEMLAVLRFEGSLPSLAFPEIEAHVEGAERGVALGADELRALASFCETAAGARRSLSRRAPGTVTSGPEAPLLWEIAEDLGEHDELIHRGRETFDASGEIRDSASPELARLRRQRDELAARTREEAETILRSEAFAPYLQDEYVTLRADRFVLPVRASFKSMGLGIVHDTSRSGETVFLEPTAVVELNNRLKVCELEIRRESRRILEELAALVAYEAPRLRQDLAILTRLDVLAASARLAAALGGERVDVADGSVVSLRDLRHPLLVLRADKEKFSVTPNDVTLGELPTAAPADVPVPEGNQMVANPSARILVISGPNAGGKTVLLKAVGLAALMVRAGLLVPCARGSRVGFFDDVLADIGDHQSVMGDLSTFSAHLANLTVMLDEVRRGSGANLLILCDELMAGTNPDQGAALARALLEAFADGRGLVITTTHYDSLKALAEGDPRFRNAGMEYDLENLRPTFRLRDGQPGRSYALDIAARMGLPDDVLDRARVLSGAASQGLEDVLRNLERREEALAREEEALTDARKDLEQRSGSEKAAAESLRKRERELAVRSRDLLEAAVRDAREALREIVKDARRVRTPEAVQAARQAVEQKAKQLTEGLPPRPAFDVDKLKEALANRALGVKSSGKPVTSAPASRGSRRDPAPEPDIPVMALQSRANTVDVRGMRADEALHSVEGFLDGLALAGADTGFVIHGHGTGALRKAVREYLALSPYVVRFRPGGAGEGGDGVSVVILKG